MSLLTWVIAGVAFGGEPSEECALFTGAEAKVCELQLDLAVEQTRRDALGECAAKPEVERAACEAAVPPLDKRIAALTKKIDKLAAKLPPKAAMDAPAMEPVAKEEEEEEVTTRAIPPLAPPTPAPDEDGMEAEDDDE